MQTIVILTALVVLTLIPNIASQPSGCTQWDGSDLRKNIGKELVFQTTTVQYYPGKKIILYPSTYWSHWNTRVLAYYPEISQTDTIAKFTLRNAVYFNNGNQEGWVISLKNKDLNMNVGAWHTDIAINPDDGFFFADVSIVLANKTGSVTSAAPILQLWHSHSSGLGPCGTGGGLVGCSTSYGYDATWAQYTIFTCGTAITQDTDSDGVPDAVDNCPQIANADQLDCNGNGKGDACDTVKSVITYPFSSVINKNDGNDTSIFSVAASLITIPANGYSFDIDDPLPNNTIHSEAVSLAVGLVNKADGNCYVKATMTGNGVTSPVKSILLTNNQSVIMFRNWESVQNDAGQFFWSYKYPPYDTKATTGNGKITVRIYTENLSGEPACNVQYGSISISTRYTYARGYQYACSSNNNSCFYGTLRFGGYCACWSGAWSRQCVMDAGTFTTPITTPWNSIDDIASYRDLDQTSMASKNFGMNPQNHPSCPTLSNWQVVSNLTTKAPPVLDSAFFQDAKLNIRVSMPLTNGRAESVVGLNDPDQNVTRPECVYPKSNFIDKEVSGCRDVYFFNIPWTIAQNCQWKVTNEETHKVYKGQVVLRFVEWTNINDWRHTQSVLRIKVRFQRFVSVDIPNPISIFTKLNLQAAITKQIVAIDLGNPALVEITTLFNWPYKLDTTKQKLTLTPIGKVSTVDYSFVDCASTTFVKGTQCKQRWKQSLNLTTDTCTLDGDYTLSWSTICTTGASATDCPLTESDKPNAVNFTLKSENFCAEITVEVGLTGTLTSYEDAAFTTARTAYIVGKTAYFKVVINSELNTSPYNANTAVVKFSDTKLISVTIRPEGASPVRVWEKGARATFSAGEDPQVNIVEVNLVAGNEVAFNFVFTSQLAALLQPNSLQRFTIGAEVQCTYQNTAKKRDSLQTDQNESSTFSSTATIDNTTPNPNPTPGTSAAYHVIASFMFLLFALLF